MQQAEAMGWSLMPTFVGLQAPCDSFSGKINPKQAASQGSAAASQAITGATTYGLGSGSPIYYDTEAYDHTNARQSGGQRGCARVTGRSPIGIR